MFYYFPIRDVVQKKTGKCGNFEKNRGGSTQIPLPFSIVFNIGDPSTINVPKVLKCKNMTFPNWGEGVPDL